MPELVQVEIGTSGDKEDEEMETVRDPVCGMEIDPASAAGSEEHEGTTQLLCSQGCHERFKAGRRSMLGRAMTRRTIGFFAVALASILAASCGSSGEGGSTRERRLREGDVAPGFTLPSGQGPEVSLADFRGQKPALLYFSMGPG